MNTIIVFLHILFKRKKWVIGSFAVIFFSVAIGVFLREPMYRAAGRMMVMSRRAYFGLAGDNRFSSRLPDPQVIQDEIENMRSPSFLVKLMDAFPQTQPLSTNGAIQAQNGATRGVVKQGQARTFNVKNLELTPVPKSSIIDVAYTDPDPWWSAAVTNAVLEAYPAHHAKLFDNPAGHLFYENQKEKFQKEVAEAEQRTLDYKRQEGIVDLEEKRKQVLSIIEKIRDRIQISDLDLDQGVGKIAAIQEQLKNEPKYTETSKEIVNPETRILHERLVTLELEKNALLQKFTEKDRRVQDKANEIEAVKQRLAASSDAQLVVGQRIDLNPVRTRAEAELIEQRWKLGQTSAKHDKLTRQLQEYTAQLVALEPKAEKLERLTEELAAKKELLALYSKKAEEARIAAELDKENLVNVVVVGKASVPSQPIPNKAALSLILAGIVGLAAGIGGALVLEYFRPTFHMPLEVEQHLELPVLALIPDMRQSMIPDLRERG